MLSKIIMIGGPLHKQEKLIDETEDVYEFVFNLNRIATYERRDTQFFDFVDLRFSMKDQFKETKISAKVSRIVNRLVQLGIPRDSRIVISQTELNGCLIRLKTQKHQVDVLVHSSNEDTPSIDVEYMQAEEMIISLERASFKTS